MLVLVSKSADWCMYHYMYQYWQTSTMTIFSDNAVELQWHGIGSVLGYHIRCRAKGAPGPVWGLPQLYFRGLRANPLASSCPLWRPAKPWQNSLKMGSLCLRTLEHSHHCTQCLCPSHEHYIPDVAVVITGAQKSLVYSAWMLTLMHRHTKHTATHLLVAPVRTLSSLPVRSSSTGRIGTGTDTHWCPAAHLPRSRWWHQAGSGRLPAVEGPGQGSYCRWCWHLKPPRRIGL